MDTIPISKNDKKIIAFTLIELLIAVAVASLVIGGVLYSITNSITLDEYSQGQGRRNA